MGNQQSTATAINNTVNQAISNVLINNSKTCSQNTEALATINFNNIETKGGCQLKWSNITQEVIQSPNLSYVQTSTDDTALRSEFQTQLDQATAASVSGLGGAINSEATSTTINNLKNTIVNNISISNIANCVQSTLAETTANWSNIKMDCTGCGLQCAGSPQICVNTCEQTWDTIKQSIIQKTVASCIQSNNTVVEAINKASNEISQQVEAANTGIDIFASFGSFSFAAIAGVIGGILLLLIIGFILYKFVFSKKGSKAPAPAPAPPVKSIKSGASMGLRRFKHRFY